MCKFHRRFKKFDRRQVGLFFGRTGGEVLIFGAGGSSIAILLHPMDKKDKADRPNRFIVISPYCLPLIIDRPEQAENIFGGLFQILTGVAHGLIQRADRAAGGK